MYIPGGALWRGAMEGLERPPRSPCPRGEPDDMLSGIHNRNAEKNKTKWFAKALRDRYPQLGLVYVVL